MSTQMKPDATTQSYIDALKSMTFQFTDPSQSTEKKKYMAALETLAKMQGGNVNFSDCQLTDAHMQMITGFLKHSYNSNLVTLDLTGKQKLSADHMVNSLEDLWRTSPKVIDGLRLPADFKNASAGVAYERLVKLWGEKTKVVGGAQSLNLYVGDFQPFNEAPRQRPGF